MKWRIIAVCISGMLAFSSCKKWIDVKPTDKLSEEMLFADKEGFLKALNGVYVELANNALYGEKMSVSTIDVLAQYYYITSTTHSSYYTTMFTYTQNSPRAAFEGIWKKAYELVVNSNIIINKCGEANPLLPAPYFGIVKGEALALRAMLHFDMLRLFGPVWSEATRGSASVPYNTAPLPTVTPLLPADTVIQRVIDDLTAAAALLKEADPVITEGVRHTASASGDNSLHYRQYRLNYYAVKALLARAYLWKHDKENALKEAKEILAEVQKPAKPIFPYVTQAAAKHVETPDRLFSTEVFFGLYTVNRFNLYTQLFAPERDQYSRLRFSNNDDNFSRVNEMLDDQNDYRRDAWAALNTTSGSFVTHLKYFDYTKAAWRYMVPLIRLSEVLLIAAECSNTVEEGRTYLNAVRNSRNCVSITPADAAALKSAITREFRKEVIGEGQMFFYYKRNASLSIPNNAALTGTKAMTLPNYVVPLPESEISVRNK
ncbi:hypothetical protein HNQ91_001056 [Filimonas zeae]|uniref:SusD family protein n=1 Tax=Filimonas zeae TaxID=1737353 RepID=A0A917MUL8_9BACT|nr:RagB/SusD family nutrient uptake outer membrane protein [Filimonas zeae]MDR6338034.1 hypothetical protein [Filimonas zeae]GGH61399.1 hypothetical protein GCM10011379_10330 [Filimonas zeae]